MLCLQGALRPAQRTHEEDDQAAAAGRPRPQSLQGLRQAGAVTGGRAPQDLPQHDTTEDRILLVTRQKTESS